MTSVLAVASEVFPLVKTGGLADVVGALPAALSAHGVTMRVMVPGYPAAIAALKGGEPVWQQKNLHGGPARLLAGTAAGLDLLVLDAPHLFGRPGNPYLGPDGADWPDNWRRFAALSFVAAEVGRGALPAFVPDVVHVHDWQAALAAVYLKTGAQPAPKTILTIHNLAFQGIFRRRYSPSSACRSRPSASTASSITAASATSRAGCNLPTRSQPCRRPTPTKSARRRAAWGSTGCCGRGAPCLRASSTASTSTSGTRRRTKRWSPPTTRRRWVRGMPTSARSSIALR